jgi:hypothetical protein
VRDGHSTRAWAVHPPAPRAVVRTMRPSRFLTLGLALAVASVGVAPAAEAASSKQCKRLAGKAKVVVKGKESLVVKRGTESNLNLKYYACLYAAPRLYAIPGQNGGDTEFYGRFTPAGRFLAYEHINSEEAATFTPGWIEMVDLKRRKRIFQFDAFPQGPMDERDTSVTQILLRRDGAVAWIGRSFDEKDYVVDTALPGQATPAEVDHGTDVGPTSLRRVVDNADAFSWTRAGVRKEAAFGGPTVMPTP